jgi:hypothetical protein
MTNWPRILIDPAQSRLEPRPKPNPFFLGVKNAAMGTIGAALLILAAWCIWS